MGSIIFVQAFAELGTEEKIMKILLVIALFGATQAAHHFAYHVGHPLVYTHPVVAPVVYANNVCKNEAGAVVPCASGVVPGSGVYNFNDAPAGLVPVVGAAAPAAAAPADDSVVSVEKREAEANPEAEAEADPYLLYANYYGHPAYYGGYYGYGRYYGFPYGYGYYAHAGLPYSYGWTDGPNNGIGPY